MKLKLYKYKIIYSQLIIIFILLIASKILTDDNIKNKYTDNLIDKKLEEFFEYGNLFYKKKEISREEFNTKAEEIFNFLENANLNYKSKSKFTEELCSIGLIISENLYLLDKEKKFYSDTEKDKLITYGLKALNYYCVNAKDIIYIIHYINASLNIDNKKHIITVIEKLFNNKTFKILDNEKKALTFLIQGDIFFDLSENLSAIKSFNQSINYLLQSDTKSKSVIHNIANNHVKKSYIYNKLNQYENALGSQIEAMNWHLKIYAKNSSIILGDKQNIALLLSTMKKDNEAEILWLEILEDDKLKNVLSIENKAKIYANIMDYYFDSNNLKEANIYSKLIEKILNKLKIEHPVQYITTLNRLGAYYSKINKYNLALDIHLKGLEFSTEFYGELHPKLLPYIANIIGNRTITPNKNLTEKFISLGLNIIENNNIQNLTLTKFYHNISIFYKDNNIEKRSYYANQAIETLSKNIVNNVNSKFEIETMLNFYEKEKINHTIFGNYFDAVEKNNLNSNQNYSLPNEILKYIQIRNLSTVGNSIIHANRISKEDSNKNIINSIQYNKELIANLQKIAATESNKLLLDKYLDDINKIKAENIFYEKKLNKNKKFLFNNDKTYNFNNIQDKLKNDEAIIIYILSSMYENKSYALLIKKREYKIIPLNIGHKDIKLQAKIITDDINLKNINYKYLNKLTLKIFEPLRKELLSINHLNIIPDKSISNFPFQLLHINKPNNFDRKGENINNIDQESLCDNCSKDTRGVTRIYGNTNKNNIEYWLGLKYSLSIIPSIESYIRLKSKEKQIKYNIKFVGVGDPKLLGGKFCNNREYKYKELFTNNLADPLKISSLCPLPETKIELLKISNTLGQLEKNNIYTGEYATEKIVKNINLENVEIISFATHALLHGELQNQEPALVLSPPKKPSKVDDGLLTTSEIKKLTLNADWVILSACNTASALNNNSEGFSGLANSFFYSGANALLVSYWPVESIFTTKITTTLFDIYKNKKKISKSEALKLTLNKLYNENLDNMYSNPLFWAPFVIVGNGS